MPGLHFVKMQGLGNDFVVLDARRRPLALDQAKAKALADRKLGVGCDQILLLEPARNGGDLYMRVLNSSGEEVGACGNGTRCVARLAMAEGGRNRILVETEAGTLACLDAGAGDVAVDMGAPRLAWDQIPLDRERETLHLDIAEGPLADPVATGMGNPHMTFFVPEVAAVPMEVIGPKLEHHPWFPQRANVGVAQVKGRDRLRLRVWERGAGLTMACGTGACAAAVAAMRRGLVDDKVTLELDGGPLTVEWRRDGDGHVIMTGPTGLSFTGELAQ